MTDTKFTRIESSIEFANNKDGTPKEEAKIWTVKGSSCGCKDDMGMPIVNVRTNNSELQYDLLFLTTHINIVKHYLDDNGEVQSSVILTLYPDSEKNLTYSKGYENGCKDMAEYLISELNKENTV